MATAQESNVKVTSKPGDTVSFAGFTSEETVEHGELLEVGAEYEVDSINEDEGSLNLIVTNPEFDAKKRKTKKNTPHFLVDVFQDEVEGGAEETDEADDGQSEFGKSVDFEKVTKNLVVTVVDSNGEYLTGPVFKKTKTMLGIYVTEDDGTEDEVLYKKAEIENIYLVEEEQEEEQEQEQEEEEEEETKKPAKKAAAKKTSSKKTSAKKSKAKAKPKAKPKAKKEPKEEVDEDLKGILILKEEEEDEEILALIEESEDICDLAAEQAEESAVSDWKLAGILYHVRISKAFRQIDDGVYDVDGGFAQYVEQELGLGYRKAMYLIEIYTTWRRYNLDSSKIAELGWTKAAQLTKVLDEDNADSLLEMAEESSVAELKETIRESYSKKGADTREVVKKVTFKFRLVEDAAAAVDGFVEQAAEQLGEKDLNKVFEHIVTEWAQEHLSVSTRKKSSRARSSRSSKR